MFIVAALAIIVAFVAMLVRSPRRRGGGGGDLPYASLPDHRTDRTGDSAAGGSGDVAVPADHHAAADGFHPGGGSFGGGGASGDWSDGDGGGGHGGD